jgi:hypothetical protein
MKIAPGLIGAVFVLVTTGGCSRSHEPPQNVTTTLAATIQEPGSCPLGVEGARIDAIDTPTGADVTITTTPEHLADLRRRGDDAAKLYGVGAHKGLGHNGQHLGAQSHGLRLTDLPALSASVEDIENGVRLHLAARLPSDAEELRSRLHERVEIIRRGPCD